VYLQSLISGTKAKQSFQKLSSNEISGTSLLEKGLLQQLFLPKASLKGLLPNT
jgi:hypothetical protein